jgi:pentatricopeptide repeat protein
VFKAIRETEQGADEMAFSHMIHCYGTAGQYQEAADIFHQMQLEGLKPSEVNKFFYLGSINQNFVLLFLCGHPNIQSWNLFCPLFLARHLSTDNKGGLLHVLK